MERPADPVTLAERRPRDLALLLLAVGTGPPRQRARDQQADLAGGDLRRRVLDRVAAIDPEPVDLGATLAEIVEQFGSPSGPTRAVAAEFLHEWTDATRTPGLWDWLLAEAIASEARPPRQGRKDHDRGAP